jgi:transposase
MRNEPAAQLVGGIGGRTTENGAQVTTIAEALGCHPKTVYRWLHRFNADGLDGLTDLPRSGRPPTLSELQRGQLIALARSTLPGRLTRQPDGTLATAAPDVDDRAAVAHWTLDALAWGRWAGSAAGHHAPHNRTNTTDRSLHLSQTELTNDH